MTPSDYVAILKELVAAGQDRAALDLADQHGTGMREQMTAEDLGDISGLLESAAMVVDLEETAAGRQKTARPTG